MMHQTQWRRARPIIWLSVGFALFLGAMVYLLASSLAERGVLAFAPAPEARRGESGVDTLTIDASAGEVWRFADLARGVVLSPPDTAGWDLAFRRFHILVADAIADAGPVPFESITRAPAGGYVRNTVATDTTNAAVRRWYRYSMLTHLLEPSGHVYIVRTREGLHLKTEMLSYYCTGGRPGCLTLRYAPLPPPEATN